jgi:Cys-tRNA(Pro)/Cys-tRNA(Cys) deacylase
VARTVGLSPEQAFTTPVARRDKPGASLAVVPGDCELDVKAAAKANEVKTIDTVPLKLKPHFQHDSVARSISRTVSGGWSP